MIMPLKPQYITQAEVTTTQSIAVTFFCYFRCFVALYLTAEEMTLLHLTPDNRQIKTTIMLMLGRAFMLCNQHKAKSSHDHKSVGLRKILLPSSPSSPSWQCPQCWEWQLQLRHLQQGGRCLGPRLRWRGLLPPWVLHHLLSPLPAQHHTPNSVLSTCYLTECV